MITQKRDEKDCCCSGGSRGAPPPPLFWVKRIAEGRKAGRASDEKPGPPIAQGLDPSLCWL